MMDFLFCLAAGTLLTHVIASIEAAIGVRSIKSLQDAQALKDVNAPKVSVIIPACNEEKTIEAALTSILSLEYDNLEILVVNDRSSDRTKEILERMTQNYSRLKVFHLSNLPSGWLGKTHSLHYGAEHASGEYFLFTDADVIMEKTALQRAINYARQQRLDHLAVCFEANVPGGLLNMLIMEWVGILFYPLLKPWKANDSKSKRFMGVGAFNLVRAEAYRKSGTHQAIAMCPVDDIMFGKLIKTNGFRQGLLWSHGLIQVAWYHSVWDMINGTRKNTFALFGFSLLKVFGITIFQVILAIWPLLSFLFTSGITVLLNGLVIITRLISFGYIARLSHIKPWYALWSLISAYPYLYIVWSSTLTTLFHQGIYWRGTFYSLRELKDNRL